MNRRFWLFGAVALLAGCGDPEKSRLSVGQKAMVVAHGKEAGDEVVYGTGIGRIGLGRLALGAHLTVVDDTNDQEHGWATREVTVHVEDGEFRGETCKLTRWHIRPE